MVLQADRKPHPFTDPRLDRLLLAVREESGGVLPIGERHLTEAEVEYGTNPHDPLADPLAIDHRALCVEKAVLPVMRQRTRPQYDGFGDIVAVERLEGEDSNACEVRIHAFRRKLIVGLPAAGSGAGSAVESAYRSE